MPKRLIQSKWVVAIIGSASLLVADLAWSQAIGIRNSKHDFSSSGSGGIWGSADTDQICIFCHAPHKALSTSLLWNRNLPLSTSFSVYDSGSMSGPTAQPKAASLRCLSCHDGSVAIDAFNAGRNWVPRMFAIGDVYYPGSPYGTGVNIGGNFSGAPSANDLTDDHPVSFIYNASRVANDGHLAAPAAVEAAGLPLFGTDPANKTLECSSCHEVHRQYQWKYLLRLDNAGSQLCRTCHLK